MMLKSRIIVAISFSKRESCYLFTKTLSIVVNKDFLSLLKESIDTKLQRRKSFWKKCLIISIISSSLVCKSNLFRKPIPFHLVVGLTDTNFTFGKLSPFWITSNGFIFFFTNFADFIFGFTETCVLELEKTFRNEKSVLEPRLLPFTRVHNWTARQWSTKGSRSSWEVNVSSP